MIIRKISIGTDYKSGAMHYLVGGSVLGGSYNICYIKVNENGSVGIYIQNEKEEVVLWKTVSYSVPYMIEYDIDFTPSREEDE